MLKKTVFIFSLLFIPILSHATTVERLSLDDLVKKANRIVIGKVANARTHWSSDRRLILTTYTIEVAETMKGQTGRTAEFTTIGGKIGDVELHVAGMPNLDPGEDAVVFIEQTRTFSTVVGLGQGKFSIRNGEVSNAIDDLTFPDGRPGRQLRMPLDSFKNRIKTLAGR